MSEMNVSTAVSMLTQSTRITIEATPRISANTSASPMLRLPVGSGRRLVRVIPASKRRSRIWLMAAAEPEASAMPSVPSRNSDIGKPEGTDRNMPTTAVKMISDTTRGLVSSKYSRASVSGWRRSDFVAMTGLSCSISVIGSGADAPYDTGLSGSTVAGPPRRYAPPPRPAADGP